MAELEPSVQAAVPAAPQPAAAPARATAPAAEPAPESARIHIDYDPYETGVTAKYRARRNWSAPDRRLEVSELPGVVVDVRVAPGQRVAAGTPIYILDAMKMHNTFVARYGGTVKRVHMKPGDKIGKNQPVLEYE